MISSFYGLFLSPLLLLTYLNCFTIARVLDSNCSHADTFAIGSPFESNLFKLLNSLANDAPLHNGFSNKSYGSQPNKVYGLVMCFAFSDYSTSDNSTCTECLQLATSNGTLQCSTSATTTVFYDSCLLSYSRKNFFSVAEPYIPSCLHSEPNQLDHNTSGYVVQTLSSLSTTVPFTTRRYSSTVRDRSISATIECTKDLPSEECAMCISNAMSYFNTCSVYGTALGMKILTRNCYISYESLLLNGDLSWYPLPLTPSLPPQGPQLPQFPPPPPPPAPSPGSKSNSTVATIVAIILAVLVAAGLAVLGTYFWRSKCSVAKGDDDDDDDMKNLHENVETELEYILNPNAEYQVFNFATLKAATDNFSDMNKLGKGGFGPVYKGTLPDGREIAVKRLSGGSVQGITEFKNEVDLLAKLKHKNLVQLLGCCMTNKEKLLCYEYLPNGSLDKILFGKDPSKQVNFGWRMRHKIIEGITRGLHYLHEESRFKIVHRDLKVSNILLDKDMSAKISDFGIARFFEEDETQKDTNLIAGTFGYMAPEYILRGNFSTKSDVYSFGVLLLEIVTGQKNSSFTGSNRISNLVDHALILWKGNKISELKDPVLEDEFNDEIGRCVHVALLCVQEDPVNRPHMETVKSMLASPSMIMPSLPSNLSVTYLTDYGRDSNMTTDTSTLRSRAESSITNTQSDESQAESSGTRNTITRNN